MRSWLHAMMVVGAGTLVGCGARTGSSNDGSGGASTGGGSGGSTTMKDCTAEADFTACRDCFEEQSPQGAQLFNALGFCIFCNACYTACHGVGSYCPPPPAEKDACDGDVTDIEACSGNMTGCFGCATADGATCGAAFAACIGSQECLDLNSALYGCPSN